MAVQDNFLASKLQKSVPCSSSTMCVVAFFSSHFSRILKEMHSMSCSHRLANNLAMLNGSSASRDCSTQTSNIYAVFLVSTNLTFTSKRVVISIPTPLYKTVTFDPPLPAAKTAIANSSHLDFTAKMMLIYESAWWRDLNLSRVFTSSIGLLAFTRNSSIEANAPFSLT